MTQFYADISNQNWGGPNFTKQGADALIAFLVAAKAAGLAGAVHKVTQGSDFTDPYWPIFRDWCEHNDFSWLGYAYIDTSDPDAQAELFASHNGGSWAMLDHEIGGGDINNMWNVANAFNANGISVSQLYLPNWYRGRIGLPDLSDLPANQISLVSSNYSWQPSGSPADIYNALGGDNGPGWQPYGGCAPTVWQFSQQASIGGRVVDCNAYKGSSPDALFTGNVF